MKIVDISDITLYKFPFVGNNLLDFKNNATYFEDFQLRFHDNLMKLFSGIVDATKIYETSNVRAFKVNGDYMEMVLPDTSDYVRLYSIIEILTFDGAVERYYYFNINSVESLKDGVQGSGQSACRIRCSINYYYTFLYEIQKGLVNTRALFSRHHVRRFNKSGDVAIPISGLEGSIGSTFNTYFVAKPNKKEILWLYLVFDDGINGVHSGDIQEEKKGFFTSDKEGSLMQGRLVFCYPLTIFDGENFYKPISKATYSFDGVDYEVNMRPSFGKIAIYDAFVSNIPPRISYNFSEGNNNIVFLCAPFNILLKDSASDNYSHIASDLIPCFEGGFTTYSPTSHYDIPINYNAFVTKTKTYGDGNYQISSLKQFIPSLDPAFNLYPFTKTGTLNGEVQYTPTRFNETFTTKVLSYYRCINAITEAHVPSITSRIYYLNTWANINGFYFYTSDRAAEFYRNNGAQLQVKYTSERFKSGMSILTGASQAGIGEMISSSAFGSQKVTIPGYMSGGKAVSPYTTTIPTIDSDRYIAGQTRSLGGFSTAAQSTIDLIASFANEEALKLDLANAQDNAYNVTSTAFQNSQMYVFFDYTPDLLSNEFKKSAEELYYFGYLRNEIDICGNNYRKFYDYKKVANIYSDITNIPDANFEIVNALSDGTTFWHLENLLSLTSEQKTQIATTCNKYGIANYEPELD